jgi:hypothetical protein
LLNTARVLAIIIVIPTLAMLWVNGQREGFETLYFLLPDIIACAALVAAAVHGRRNVLLAAYPLAAGVFMTATFGDYWTKGLAGMPPGAAIGVIACAVMIGLLLRGK